MENKLEKVLDILNKFEFFYGQRAGRELWVDKPVEVQNQDIIDFVNNIKYIKDFLNENIILSREELAQIEEREKQIEEMAYIIENAFKVYFGANDLVEPEDFPYQAKDLAKELLEHFQSKLPEDSVVQPTIQSYSTQDNDLVVISKKEYEKYQNLKRDTKHSFEYNQGYTDGQNNGSKEMAEKIMQDLKPLLEGFVHTDTGENLYVYKCKQFGVEIKE